MTNCHNHHYSGLNSLEIFWAMSWNRLLDVNVLTMNSDNAKTMEVAMPTSTSQNIPFIVSIPKPSMLVRFCFWHTN